jgi:ethanolamine utilization protein EutM
MKMYALGLIETVGYTTAVSAADVALKAADVTLVALEKVIGVGGSLGVTIHLNGDVGAVQSAVEAGKKEAERVGKLISAHVIPRAHSDVDQKLLSQFSLLEKEPKEPKEPKSIDKKAQRKKQAKEEILTEQKDKKETKTKNANSRAKKDSKKVTKEKQIKEENSKENSSNEENPNDGLIIEDQNSERMNPEKQDN